MKTIMKLFSENLQGLPQGHCQQLKAQLAASINSASQARCKWGGNQETGFNEQIPRCVNIQFSYVIVLF